MKTTPADAGNAPPRVHRRLFWKILFGFWITFLTVSEGVWVVAFFYRDNAQVVQAQRALRIESARGAIAYGGIPALRTLTSHWTPEQRGYLRVIVDEGAHPAFDEKQAPVVGPDGTRYQIDYRPVPPPPPPRTWLHMPPDLLILGVLGGLVFSTLLAAYLTWPLRRLRQGIARFAGGDLGVRVQPSMRRRHDEISDLAADFDRMAERIEHLVMTRERLLNDVSHELRSPLARLAVAAELLRRRPEQGGVALARIDREVHRLDRLVDEVMTLARAESGSPPMDEYVDLAGLADAVGQDVGFEAAAHDVRVAVAVDARVREGDEATIKGSVELLRRMLENVVRNAVRFSRPGGTVEILLQPDDGGRGLRLAVADEGPGVPDEALAHIFDPFVRVDEGGDRSGHGLGLAIARRAAEAHGGHIAAANRPAGGLCVTVTLPGGVRRASTPRAE